MYRGGRGNGGKFSRVPPSRWSNHSHHPYRGGGETVPPMGMGPVHRMGPVQRLGHVGADRNFRCRGSDNGPDKGSSVKLYVGSVPSNATEEDIRPFFEEHGYVTEVVFIKDHRTGQQQNYCFVKYASLESAENAIAILNDSVILPGASIPMKVKLAGGKRPRVTNCFHDKPSFNEFRDDTSTMETQCWNLPTTCPYPNEGIPGCKLYVGSLSKQATEKEVMELFSPFGKVEDVFILKDLTKQSRGVCFVEYSNREMSEAAIKELNGTYTMNDHIQPLVVRFAVPKKPKLGDFRGGPTHMNPGFHPHPNVPLGYRPAFSPCDQLDAYGPHVASRSYSPQPNGPLYQRGLHLDPGFHPHPLAPVELRPTSSNNDKLDVHIPHVASLSFSPQPDEIEPPLQVNMPEHSEAINVDQYSSAEQNIPLDIQLKSSVEQKDMTQLEQDPATSSSQQQSQHGSMVQSDSTTSSKIATFHISCKWSEHFCPDGFKYYYNCITQESKWEKPKEYADFEKQQRVELQELQKACSAMHMISPSQMHLHSHTPPIETSR